MTYKNFFSLCLLFASLNTEASLLGRHFFLEPLVAYRSENISLTDLTNNLTQIKSSGPSYGTKLGFRSAVGIDLNFVWEIFSGKADYTGQIDKVHFNHTSTSFQIGVNSLGLVKMYLGTAFQNQFKTNDTASLQSFTLKGPNYQAGLQLKLWRALNLGAQYNLNQYNEISGNSYTNGSKLNTYFSKIDTQDYILFLSATF